MPARLAAAACLLTATAPALGAPDPRSATSPAAQRAPEVRLAARQATLPIVMVREFPFVEGEVAGVKGKFMHDTGMLDALVLNGHRVPLTGGTKIGSGFFDSGQTLDVLLHAAVRDVRIGGIRIPRATSVRSQDARMLEKIAPDFLGWIDYRFFADHALKLDYRRARATFTQDPPERYLRGEIVVAELPFTTRKLPNHPLLPARIGDVDAVVSLDTGMNGSLAVPPQKKARLIAGGHLTPTGDSDTYRLSGARIGGEVDVDLPAIETEEGPSAAAGSIGIMEDVEIELGYMLLHRYKTVRDFRRKRLYLLAR